MSVITTSARRRTGRIVGFGLVAAGAFVAFCAILGGVVIAVILASGVSHTDQGWVFAAHLNSADAAEVRAASFDPNTYTLLVQGGSGPSQTHQLATTSSWTATWAYSCPSDSGSFHLVARGHGQAFPAGALTHVGSGVGQSNDLPAGSYTLQVTTDPGCNWTVGARPNH